MRTFSIDRHATIGVYYVAQIKYNRMLHDSDCVILCRCTSQKIEDSRHVDPFPQGPVIAVFQNTEFGWKSAITLAETLI